jgi:peptidoglycan hydrolase-like protein with peptidoglycan-binding domain
MASLFARFLGSSVAAAAALRAFPFSSSSSDDTDIAIATARKAAELAELRSRQRKAEAEADKVKAEAAEAANRADKVKAEMAEAANRADKVKAEMAEAANRADKVKAETRASEKSANDSLWARRAAAGVLVFGGLFLAYDHYTHHNKAYLLRRIKAKLVAGPDENLLPKSAAFPVLALPPLPIQNMNRPVIVLGASGSGKSSQLAELARTFKAKGVPVVYFRFRAARELDPDGSPRKGQPQASPSDLTVAAQRFYKAVGYPERASIVSRWIVGGFGLSADGVRLSAAREHVESRFREAISDLYIVCGELYEERMADPLIAPSDRKPVVLSDELHDLLHDRYRNVGGQAVFGHFGNEMTQSDVDAGVSRTILSASGADMLQELRTRSAARSDRVFPYMQPDPSVSSVRERLAAVGYDPATVDAIVATCGTRVRLLTPFLHSRLADVPSCLQSLKASAAGKVDALMARCPEKADKRKLIRLLDKLALSPTSAELLGRFPAAVQKPFPTEALLRHVDGRVSFQTEAVRQAWIRTRGSYVV